MKVGFIGLGIMGQPMASRLLRAGHELYAHARNPERAAPLRALGAHVCENSAAVAAASDMTFVMVADTHDVEQVIFGSRGIAEGAKPGHMVVDMSTVSPLATQSFAERLQEKGIHMLDAPVSGGEQGAIDGTLTIMVGGDKARFERALPLFSIMGQKVTHIGANGAGQVAKACNQILVAQQIAAVGEALLLAKACGVDPALVREALLGGFASSKILEVHGQRMLDHNFKPGFKARLHKKDLRIALETAADKGLALPGTALVSQYIHNLVGHDGGELDSSALVTLLENLNHLKL